MKYNINNKSLDESFDLISEVSSLQKQLKDSEETINFLRKKSNDDLEYISLIKNVNKDLELNISDLIEKNNLLTQQVNNCKRGYCCNKNIKEETKL